MANTCKKAVEASQAPMPDLLSTIGEELEHLASAVERLHQIVELPGVRSSLQDAASLHAVQGIDHVTQHLVALSEFFARISAEVPSHWALDTGEACDRILIATLSERLRHPHAPRRAPQGNDDCEFF
jgi:hypothetical protein